jgi:Cbb3-type cytochrome oxidase, subunit 3
MMAWINALATVVSMATFLGIAAWAWSARRRPANRESAMLPFALPEEFEAADRGAQQEQLDMDTQDRAATPSLQAGRATR